MTPQTFRKKPVEIQAMPAGAAAADWLREHLGDGYDPAGDEAPASGWSIDPATGFLLIATLEGVMQAKPGDWIIRGTQGEFYPCKPDAFAATFEEVRA